MGTRSKPESKTSIPRMISEDDRVKLEHDRIHGNRATRRSAITRLRQDKKARETYSRKTKLLIKSKAKEMAKEILKDIK